MIDSPTIWLAMVAALGSRHVQGRTSAGVYPGQRPRWSGFSFYFPGSNDRQLTVPEPVGVFFLVSIPESRWTVRLAFRLSVEPTCSARPKRMISEADAPKARAGVWLSPARAFGTSSSPPTSGGEFDNSSSGPVKIKPFGPRYSDPMSGWVQTGFGRWSLRSSLRLMAAKQARRCATDRTFSSLKIKLGRELRP